MQLSNSCLYVPFFIQSCQLKYHFINFIHNELLCNNSKMTTTIWILWVRNWIRHGYTLLCSCIIFLSQWKCSIVLPKCSILYVFANFKLQWRAETLKWHLKSLKICYIFVDVLADSFVDFRLFRFTII